MPTELFLTRVLNGTPDLQLGDGESLDYTSGTKERTVNQHVESANPTLPAGWDTLLDTQVLTDNADPPNIIGYRHHVAKVETVPQRFGGVTLIETRRVGLRTEVALMLVHSTQPKLDAINTRLRAVDSLYGRVPLNPSAGVRETMATRLEAKATAIEGSRPAVADALDSAAVDLRAGDGVKIALARLLGIQRRHVDVSVKEPSSE